MAYGGGSGHVEVNVTTVRRVPPKQPPSCDPYPSLQPTSRFEAHPGPRLTDYHQDHAKYEVTSYEHHTV